jgi:hypothetical protein
MHDNSWHHSGFIIKISHESLPFSIQTASTVKFSFRRDLHDTLSDVSLPAYP